MRVCCDPQPPRTTTAISTLGGALKLIADFGGEQLKIA
jgi:hypothetical protein